MYNKRSGRKCLSNRNDSEATFVPLYAWKCPKCGYRFEVLASIEKRDEAAVCEKCGEKAVRDYTGSCAFGAKGSGGCSGNCGCCGGCHH